VASFFFLPLQDWHLDVLRRFFDLQTRQLLRLLGIDTLFLLYRLLVVDPHLVPLISTEQHSAIFGGNSLLTNSSLCRTTRYTIKAKKHNIACALKRLGMGGTQGQSLSRT
jgi:hypothetical protein